MASKAIPEKGFIVVTHVGAQTFGIVVDSVFHTEEIVVKPMASKLRTSPCSPATPSSATAR